MDDNLTDQQQAEVVKQWLKDNGLSILFSIGLGISAYFGLQFYQQTQLKESESASRLYAEVEFALKQQRMAQAQNFFKRWIIISLVALISNRAIWLWQSYTWIHWIMIMPSFS